jgi:polysaccharide biosynthesis/export protein
MRRIAGPGYEQLLDVTSNLRGEMSKIFRGRIAVAGLMLLALGACETATTVRPIKTTPLEEVLVIGDDFNRLGYVINTGDDLTVRFYYNPQLDEDLRVRPDGKISLALIGEVQAAGKVPEALSNDITTQYRTFLNRPNAVVILRRFASARAFLGGEVQKPGLLDMQQQSQTVLQSIAAAGGVTENATLEEVVVLRRVSNWPEPLVFKLNLKKALDGTDPRQNVLLLPNDLVYVPRSDIADVNLALRQYIFNNLQLSTSAGITYGIK